MFNSFIAWLTFNSCSSAFSCLAGFDISVFVVPFDFSRLRSFPVSQCLHYHVIHFSVTPVFIVSSRLSISCFQLSTRNIQIIQISRQKSVPKKLEASIVNLIESLLGESNE